VFHYHYAQLQSWFRKFQKPKVVAEADSVKHAVSKICLEKIPFIIVVTHAQILIRANNHKSDRDMIVILEGLKASMNKNMCGCKDKANKVPDAKASVAAFEFF
jgi:hypothetical protein